MVNWVVGSVTFYLVGINKYYFLDIWTIATCGTLVVHVCLFKVCSSFRLKKQTAEDSFIQTCLWLTSFCKLFNICCFIVSFCCFLWSYFKQTVLL